MAAIHLQERDCQLFADLGEVDVMDTEMIRQRRFPKDRTGEACRRRMRMHRKNGHVSAIRLSVTFAGQRRGKFSTVYRLTRAGGELLRDLTGEPPRRLLRFDPKPATLLHRLGVARTQLAVSDACEIHGLIPPVWILEQDSRPDASRKASRTERFVLYEDVPAADGKALALRPDASSLIRIDANGTTHALAVWWEIDNSTETLGTVASKIPAYDAFLRGHETCRDAKTRPLYCRHWPQVQAAVVRVFFVCKSQERVTNISRAIKDEPGSRFVRLAVASELTPSTFLSDPIWQTVAGERRAILESFRSASSTSSVPATNEPAKHDEHNEEHQEKSPPERRR